MFVSMNIAEKARLYREVHRVLKSGGWLVLSEIAPGETGDVTYPMPWARGHETDHMVRALRWLDATDPHHPPLERPRAAHAAFASAQRSSTNAMDSSCSYGIEEC
jgi:SAM-dependent methyltransferase